MTAKLLRGRILSFHAEPHGGDQSALTYIEDGALLIRDGIIAKRGEYATFRDVDAEVIDHRPNLLMAGFIDTHIHFPQVQVIASWGAQLLDWLENYTFPAEMQFADPDHGGRMAPAYFDLLNAHGTTTAVSYCSVHRASAEAYFEEAARRNMCVIGGKVMMLSNQVGEILDGNRRFGRALDALGAGQRIGLAGARERRAALFDRVVLGGLLIAESWLTGEFSPDRDTDQDGVPGPLGTPPDGAAPVFRRLVTF